MSDIKKSYRTIMDDNLPEDMVITFGQQTLVYKKGHGRYLMRKQGS